MESDRTEAEVLSEAQTAMGDDLGELYFLLQKEHVFLSIKWKEFKALFASKSAIDVLNNVAPAFFWQVHRSLWQDIILHICRLTDPPKIRGNENLTVLAIPDLIAAKEIKDAIESSIENTRRKVRFARRWRNKVFSHRDLETARNQDLRRALPTASRKCVEEAVAALDETLKGLASAFGISGTDDVFLPLGGSARLLEKLTAWTRRRA